jgi:Tol biopolymer transport system component
LDVGNYAGISFTFPVWSPDGSHIAAVNTYSDNRNEIFVGVFTNGKIDAEFTFGGGAGDTTTLTQPRWSSDGKSIYFASNENGNFDIFRLNADGSGGGWVVTDPSDDEAPSEFSP